MQNTENLGLRLKSILQEWHEFPLPDIVPRQVDTQPLFSSRISSVIGPRRAGKTWFCFQMMSELLGKGLPRENLLYINFEDERLHPLTGNELTLLLETHTELMNPKKDKELWCFLDEIQNVPNWSKWVRRVTDQNRNVHVVVTGSSSKLLSTEIATELRGRSVSATILPYSFHEFLIAHHSQGLKNGFNDPSLIFSPKRIEIKRIYRLYLLKGGFPGLPDEGYRDILQEYYRAMFSRDIIERFKVQNIRLFEDFLKVQISRFASLSSISNLEKEMVGLGYRLSKNTLNAYLGYAKDTFLLFEAPIYSAKVKNQLLYPRKIYGIDQGLLNAIRFSTSKDNGRILENMVYLELRRRKFDLYYSSDPKTKSECDFLIVKNRKVIQAIQVCYALESDKTKSREIRGLIDAMETYGLKQGLILTDDQHDEIKIEGKKILIQPFWFFALIPVTFSPLHQT